MNRVARIGVGLAWLAGGGACAQKVVAEFDETADFSKYKTYALRNGQINSKLPALKNELAEKRIKSQIQKRLGARGFSENTALPDLLVRYSLGSANRKEVETYPAGVRGWGRRRQVIRYTEGTLIIDLRDADTKSLVWRAIVTDNQRDPAKIEQRLDQLVEKAFSKYPPKKK